MIAPGEARNFASGGQDIARGAPQGPRDTHLRDLGRSVCDPVLRTTNNGGREGPCLRKGHPPWPPTSNSGGGYRITNPMKGQCTPSCRYGGPDGMPLPWESAPTPG